MKRIDQKLADLKAAQEKGTNASMMVQNLQDDGFLWSLSDRALRT